MSSSIFYFLLIPLRQMTPFISQTELANLSNEERLAYADYVSDYMEDAHAANDTTSFSMFINSLSD